MPVKSQVHLNNKKPYDGVVIGSNSFTPPKADKHHEAGVNLLEKVNFYIPL